MKKSLYKIIIAVICIAGTNSCSKVLDLKPLDAITDPSLWSNQDNVKAYTGNFYAQLTSGFTPNDWLIASITDDAAAPDPSSGARSLSNPTYTAFNFPMSALWTNRYQYIRRANEFLEKIDHVPGDAALNQRMKAEIRFFRAYYYFDLVRYFGGVPLVLKSQSLDEDIFLPRNTESECYTFITSELNDVANALPTAYPASDMGRITKQAALGLKCEAHLYKSEWTAAASTAEQIIALGVNSLMTSYDQVFSVKNNPEILLAVQHNNRFDERGHFYDKNVFSPWYGGKGNNCPTQNLVNDYEMKATGLPITDPASGYDMTRPYVGRDPRFYTTILYDGATFKNRTMQMYTGGEDITAGGPNGISVTSITNTGYYLRKFTDETFSPFGDANARSGQNWIIIRYAEILLNYAEALNEISGPDVKVYNAVNSVRNRVGMPSLPPGLSQAAMRDAIHHERRIELAFEDQRYWDVKRWKLATALFNSATNQLSKVVITKDSVTGGKTYTYVNVSGDTRVFQDKHYLFPIPATELSKAGNKMMQNPGW